MKLLSRIFIVTIFGISFQIAHGQILPEEKQTVYKVNRKIEIPATAVLFGTYFLGLDAVGNKSALTADEIELLNPDDIWWFDRKATMQDPSYRHEAQEISDYAMKATVVLPVFLMFDKKMRRDWFDLLVLYGETHALSGNTYVITALLYDRNRPYVYSSGLATVDKMGSGTKNSFFSGHTSTTASASFFMAKTYSDYHPEFGNKKYFLFAAALIPPLFVGYYRYRALKHFPTDVFVGLSVGALSGILVPHFHKRQKKEGGFSFLPFAGQINGLQVTYSIP